MDRRTFVNWIATTAASGCCGACTAQVASSELRQIIEREIRLAVRDSWGELDGENFTERDLDAFHKTGKVAQIVRKLRVDASFKKAIAKLSEMTSEAREVYLIECRKPLRPTWAELGQISRKGTTEAGRVAELDIAAGICDLAVRMVQELGARRAGQ